MKKSIQSELEKRRRRKAVELFQNGNLALMFRESNIVKPAGISEESWEIVLKAEHLVGRLELEHLEAMLLSYLDAVKRADGCKCFQCRKRARIMTEILDEELERLRHDLTKENQDEKVERQLVVSDIAFGIDKLKDAKRKEMRSQFEKREKEWLKRAERIRQLISKVVKHNSQANKGLTPEERAEIQLLLAQARERRKDWDWKNW